MENNVAIVEKILAKDEKFISKIYLENKSIFIGYFKNHYNTPEETVLEIYQESMYIMYRKIASGGNLTSKLSVFLIGIGKNLMREILRKEPIVVADDNDHNLENERDNSDISDRKADLVIKHVAKLNEPCKSILEYVYWEKLKLPVILKRLQSFTSIESLKAQKYKCQQRLKNQLSAAFENAGLI